MDTVDEDALLVHDAHRDDPGLAFMLSRLAHTPHGPTPIGLFRQVERPVYGTELNRQLDQAVERRGKGDLATLLAGSDSWTVAG
jgi:2-oxoglutarate ferredoxin oxidoreductase subunit beta